MALSGAVVSAQDLFCSSAAAAEDGHIQVVVARCARRAIRVRSGVVLTANPIVLSGGAGGGRGAE